MRELFFSGALVAMLISQLPAPAYSQLQRVRTVTDEPVEIFPAMLSVGLSTTTGPEARNLITTVTHAFGLVEGGIDHFFGLDDGANTRIGLDYGISDRLSLGLSRMTFFKVVDLRGKWILLRQMTSGNPPMDLAVKGSVSVSTLSGTGQRFQERLVWFSSLIAAHRIGPLSLQISPMAAWFNDVAPGEEKGFFAAGVAGNYRLSDRFSLGLEYIPLLSEPNPGGRNPLALHFDIETGGHVFQLFLASSQWHNEPWILAQNRNRFLEGDFRFGFSIHRVFGL